MSVSREEKKNIVLSSLKNINTILPPENQIKIIIFFYSQYSKKSLELIRQIPQNYFYFISVDNKSIRERILKSETIKIKYVPSILLIDAGDNVSIFENNDVLSFIQTVINLDKKYQLSTHGPNCNCEYHKQATPLTQITQEELQDLTDVIDDDKDRLGGIRRRKVRTATRPQDNTEIPREDPPEVGISSMRSYPIKGSGHETMASSSLKDFTSQPQRESGINGGESLEDLDELLEEDPTLDPDIKQIMGRRKNVDKKEMMDNVKKQAQEMQRMREMELEKKE